MCSLITISMLPAILALVPYSRVSKGAPPGGGPSVCDGRSAIFSGPPFACIRNSVSPIRVSLIIPKGSTINYQGLEVKIENDFFFPEMPIENYFVLEKAS